MGNTTHIVVIPSAGFSHFFPIIEFSKRLVHLHPDVHVSCIIPSIGSIPSSSKAIIETLPQNITSIFLPPVNINDLPQDVPVVVQIQLAMQEAMPSIHEVLKSISSKTPSVAMVVDSFAVGALEFAKEFNMLSYVYFPCAAFTLLMHFHLPKLDEETTCEYRDLPEPIKLPGCVPFHGRDLYATAQDRSSQLYKVSLQRYKSYLLLDGIIMNSFLEFEKGAIRSLQEEGKGYPPVYPVGPIVQSGKGSGELECLKWLDKQQPCSVLYVCFGSGASLSYEQMVELAYGLELSNQKFLWVVKEPNTTAHGTYLGGQKDVDPVQFLPSGFLERTKDRGMAVSSWVPQVQVLSHSSVGGFLSHCGWNSTIESMMHGVPMITWPLFAEQKMNSITICEAVKTGVRPRANENGLVEREEVAKVVKCLMEEDEGATLRNRSRELKEAAANALKEDGSSTNTFTQLTDKWRNLAQGKSFG